MVKSSRRGWPLDATDRQTAIRKILRYDWDPIGVYDEPSAEDEYDTYVMEVDAMLDSDADRKALYAYLWRVETEGMGLRGAHEVTERVVELLLKTRV